jgi:ADP-heptose:LPS heptosyltransferase
MPTPLRKAVRAQFARLRRVIRSSIGRLLVRLGGGAQDRLDRIDPAAVRSVLVVRTNGRLGNTMFLTTLLKGLAEALPGASIDLLIHYPHARELLCGLPLRNIFIPPHRRWGRLPGLWQTIRAVRRETYDLAIDPTPNSTSGRFALILCRSRWRLGFGGAEQWVRLSCAVQRPSGSDHEALRPLALLAEAFGYRVDPAEAHLHLMLDEAELVSGKAAVSASIADRITTAGRAPRVIGFFAAAKRNKRLEPEWWRAFLEAYLALDPDAVPLEFLPVEGHEPVDRGYAVIHCDAPRPMAAAIAGTALFVCGDTGPMHLASATRVPTVALFRVSNPAHYGPLKPDDLSLCVDEHTPESVAQTCHGLLQGENVPESRHPGIGR